MCPGLLFALLVLPVHPPPLTLYDGDEGLSLPVLRKAVGGVFHLRPLERQISRDSQSGRHLHGDGEEGAVALPGAVGGKAISLLECLRGSLTGG